MGPGRYTRPFLVLYLPRKQVWLTYVIGRLRQGRIREDIGVLRFEVSSPDPVARQSFANSKLGRDLALLTEPLFEVVARRLFGNRSLQDVDPGIYVDFMG